MRTEKEKKNKIIKLVFTKSIYGIIIIMILYNIVFLMNSTIFQNNYLKLCGITLLCMENDLMQDDINKNDLVIVKEVRDKDLQEGDIIAYNINGKIRINKIMNKQKQYITKSNKNYYPDIEKVTSDDIIGKKISNIRFGGYILKILQSKATSIFLFLILILKFWYNRYMYIKKSERAKKKNANLVPVLFFASAKKGTDPKLAGVKKGTDPKLTGGKNG